MAEHEFTHVTKAEQAKILLAKLVLGLFIANEFYNLTNGTGDVSTRLAAIGSILLFTYGYINLMHIKSEFAQLFEPPYLTHGLEFFFLGVLVKIASWLI
jgi:hypothetical protein